MAVQTPQAESPMDTKLGMQHDFTDPRDAFRNGFVAAVTHLRGQRDPTSSQICAAVDELNSFRLANPDFDCQRTMLRNTISALLSR